MESILLGELKVSRLGLGGCPLGGHGWGSFDESAAEAAVRQALDAGVNFFDTADIYGLGRSEELLARALGTKRHELVIASKYGVRRDAAGATYKDISPRYLRQALEASLRRLRLDCLPLYYIHWPDGRTPIEAAIAELDRCREEGKIRAIGVSNFSCDQLARACGVAKVSAGQVQYSLVDRTEAEKLGAVARQFEVQLVTWGSLSQGLLTGKFNRETRFDTDDRRHRYANFQGERYRECLAVVDRVRRVAKQQEKSAAQIAMRWLLDTPGVGCVLFGAKSPEQVRDNLVAGQAWRLSADDYNWLAEQVPYSEPTAAEPHEQAA